MIYILVIVGYSYIKKTSVIDARCKVNTILKEIIGLTEQEEQFPVFIGYDEGEPNAAIIEEEFQELEDIFTSVYLASSNYKNNIITYVFSINHIKKDIETDDLKEYIKRVCESIVHRFMHRYCTGVGKILNLVAIELNNNYLYVYVATTISATERVAKYKENVRKCLKKQEVNTSLNKRIEV